MQQNVLNAEQLHVIQIAIGVNDVAPISENLEQDFKFPNSTWNQKVGL